MGNKASSDFSVACANTPMLNQTNIQTRNFQFVLFILTKDAETVFAADF
jgi:hypothetical protein